MKELKFDKSLNDNIGASKKEYNLKENIFELFKILLVVLISIGLGVFIVNSNIICGIIGVLVAFGYWIGVTVKESKKVKKNRKLSEEQLSLLENELIQEGVRVNLKSLQESVITETRIITETTDRKGVVSNTDEIIKRFYMLDEDVQIRVLQETLKTSKLLDGSCVEDRSLCLLEEEDLKTIEMPNVIKSLKFIDSEKK